MLVGALVYIYIDDGCAYYHGIARNIFFTNILGGTIRYQWIIITSIGVHPVLYVLSLCNFVCIAMNVVGVRLLTVQQLCIHDTRTTTTTIQPHSLQAICHGHKTICSPSIFLMFCTNWTQRIASLFFLFVHLFRMFTFCIYYYVAFSLLWSICPDV